MFAGHFLLVSFCLVNSISIYSLQISCIYTSCLDLHSPLRLSSSSWYLPLCPLPSFISSSSLLSNATGAQSVPPRYVHGCGASPCVQQLYPVRKPPCSSPPPQLPAFTSFLPLLPQCALRWGCGYMGVVGSWALTVTYTPHLNHVWVSIFTTTHCEQELL